MNAILGNRLFLLFILLGLILFAFQFEPIPEEAKTYPFILLMISLLITSYLFVKPISSKAASGGDDAIYFAVRVVLFAASILIYILLIPRISYFLATLIFTFGILYFSGFRKKIVLIVLPCALTLIVYLFFSKILGVFLPEGSWISIYF